MQIEFVKKARDVFLNELCKGMFEAYQKNGNKLPYRHLINLLKEAKPDNEWLTHNILNKAFIKYRSKQVLGGSNDAVEVRPSTVGFIGASTSSLLSDLSNVSCNSLSKTKISRKICWYINNNLKKVKPGSISQIVQPVYVMRGVSTTISF